MNTFKVLQKAFHFILIFYYTLYFLLFIFGACPESKGYWLTRNKNEYKYR